MKTIFGTKKTSAVGEKPLCNIAFRAESFLISAMSFFVFGFTVFRRRVGFERGEQLRGSFCYFVDGGFKSFEINRRRFLKTAQLADKLPGGGTDFFIRGGRFEIMELFNVSAHDGDL